MNKKLKEAKELIGLTLDFWSAPGIDMPDVDTFDRMVRFMGRSWKSPWDAKGLYIGKFYHKPVGMTWEEFVKRERKTRFRSHKEKA